jgi:hypothetical protein
MRNRYLGFICSNFHETKLYSPLAEHYLDINESGRCLIEGDHPIPLSVWPIVLERVNQKLTRQRSRWSSEIEGSHSIPVSVWSIVLERVNQNLTQQRDGWPDDDFNEDEDRNLCRRANAIYYLLHGPALAARESLV